MLDFFKAKGGPDQGAASPEVETSVPANLIGATSQTQLNMAEDIMGAFRGWQVSASHERIPGDFDAKHLRQLHAHLMQDVYPDVGGTRNDELRWNQREQQRNPAHQYETATARKGANGEGIALWPAGEVNSQLDKLSRQLREENNLMGLDKGEFVNRLADYYTRYAHAAPFSTGNQQVLNTAFQQLGREAGYEVELAHAPMLARVTDAVIRDGVASKKAQLENVLHTVVTEAEGPEAALRRKITMQVVQPKQPPDLAIREQRGELLQAGINLAQRVGGEEGQAFRASMRAIAAGDLAPAHLNQVRTTARAYGGEMPDDADRIERATHRLDTIRRDGQAQGREREAALPRPGREFSQPAEITR